MLLRCWLLGVSRIVLSCSGVVFWRCALLILFSLMFVI